MTYGAENESVLITPRLTRCRGQDSDEPPPPFFPLMREVLPCLTGLFQLLNYKIIAYTPLPFSLFLSFCLFSLLSPSCSQPMVIWKDVQSMCKPRVVISDLHLCHYKARQPISRERERASSSPPLVYFFFPLSRPSHVTCYHFIHPCVNKSLCSIKQGEMQLSCKD